MFESLTVMHPQLLEQLEALQEKKSKQLPLCSYSGMLILLVIALVVECHFYLMWKFQIRL